MIDLGLSKMALIGVVALIVIGPEKLPRVARTVGTLLGKAQRYVNDVKAEVNRSMELDELRKMKESVETAARDVETSVRTGAADFEKQWSEAVGTPDGRVRSRRLPGTRSTGIPTRSGASSRAPPRIGTRPATVSAPGPCRGPPAWRATGRRSSTDVPTRQGRRARGHRAAVRRPPGGAARPAAVQRLRHRPGRDSPGDLARTQRVDRLHRAADPRPHAAGRQADRGRRVLAVLRAAEGAADGGRAGWCCPG